MKVVKKSVEKPLKKKTLKEKKKKQAQNSTSEYVEKKKLNKKEKKEYNNNNNIDEEDDEILFNQEDFEKKKQKSLENKILLSKKLKEIKLQFKDYHDDDQHNNNNKNSWIETLDITSTEYYYLKRTELFGISESREKQLQHITHINVIKGLQQLQALNINFNRPYDFLADMLKSDIHMEKIRQKILKEHEQAEIRETNKLKRINKKFLKKCGSQKIKSHKEALEKKQNLLKIDQLKKTNNLQNLNVQEFFLKHSKDHDNKSAKKNLNNKEKKNKPIKNKQLTKKKNISNKRKGSSKNSSKNKKIKKKHKHKNRK